jgi:hypothetical protein
VGATQLGVYNKALRFLEERKLASLTENREPRRYLDDEWADAVIYCLSQGYWKHSIRNVQMNAEVNQNPNFGFQFAFLKPDDWISTFQVADNEVYMPLLRRYDDQNNYWYSDITPIYVKYTSSDPRFGLNMALWTPNFVEYLAGYLAQLLCPRIKQAADKIDRIDKLVVRLRREGLAKDAMDLPPGKIPYGDWVMSRAPRGSILPYGNPYPWSIDD